MVRQIVEKAIKSLHERKYVNPETDPFWLIDYRTYDPEGDGKSKLDHLQEMLTNGVYLSEATARLGCGFWTPSMPPTT